MKSYILIGGIGSGKTTVAKMFAERGASLIDLDEIGHEVLRQPDVIEMLVDTFGDGIVDADGAIDRAELARLAFASSADTIRLNAISQPRLLQIAQQRERDLKKAGCSIAIWEISAFEGPEGRFAPVARTCDGIIAVTAPISVRVDRAVAKGFDEHDVRNRISRQVNDSQRKLWANYDISNKGSFEELAAQVDAVWAKIAPAE